MTKGEKVVELALSYRWVHETGYNSGPKINEWSARWGWPHGGQPWCGIFADAMFAEADVSDSSICHPSTQEMCNRAKARGLLHDGGYRAKPGDVWLKCGTHTGIVQRDLGNGSVLTIDGNSGGGRVYPNIRSKYGYGVHIIEIPESAVEVYVAPKFITHYYLEDLDAEPYVYRLANGKVPQWNLRNAAQVNCNKLAKNKHFAAASPRVVKIGNGNFAIQLGNYRYYDYLNKKKRDEKEKKLRARFGPARRLRTFSKKIQVKGS